MVTIPSDFLEFFALLNAHEVQYVVVGGYAVVVYIIRADSAELAEHQETRKPAERRAQLDDGRESEATLPDRLVLPGAQDWAMADLSCRLLPCEGKNGVLRLFPDLAVSVITLYNTWIKIDVNNPTFAARCPMIHVST